MFKKISILAFSILLLLGLAACSDDSSSEGGGGSDDEIELVFWKFPGMGFEDIIEDYKDIKPNVKITIQEADYNAHHQNLMTALAAGSGAPDIAVVESDFIERFKQNTNQFHNLKDYGADDIAGDYLEWRWKEASTTDGSFVLGIPTDVGPMAMAYRMDLFEEAGLPSDPDEVAALFATWDDYIDAGRQLKEKTGSFMFNTAGDFFRVVREQATEQYFDADGNLILEESAQVAKAWDLAVNSMDIQANIARETPEWGAAINNGDIATVFLPPWMLQQIKDNGPDAEGKWNVTQIPEASGNWGGSLLAVPSESKHPQEAYDFIAWLMSPEQQLEYFVNKGNFPSTPSVYSDERLQNHSDPYFTREDLGAMLAVAAERVQYVYRSPDSNTINTIFQDALTSIADGAATADEAWNTILTEVDNQVSR